MWAFPESVAMEASPLSTASTEDWIEEFDQSLNLQRDGIREFLDAQQERFQRVETELNRQLQQLADELAGNREEVHQAREEVQQRSERLAREAETLAGLKEELDTRQAQWEKLQEGATRQQEALVEQIRQQQEQLDHRGKEFAERQVEVDAAEARLHHDHRALELARQEHQAGLEQLATLRAQLEGKQAELDTQREQLAATHADTEKQRRRIARELNAQRAAQRKELERRRAELERQDAREQAELSQQLDAAQQQLAKVADELKASEQRAEQLESELEALRGQHDQLQQEQTQRACDGGVDAEALKRVETERDALLGRLSETESRLADAQRSLAESQEAGAAGSPADEDARRRYEMVLDDLRELKAQNAELQQQLAQAKSARPAAQATGGIMNWEAEKRRLLAALESDFDENNEEAKAERLRIEDVIEKTDQALAEKDRECSELKRLLDDQSANLGSVAVGAAAVGQVIDSDAIVQEERQKLTELQQQWREKLRQAEIDISIERAKLAREKAEFEERLAATGKGAHPPEGEARSSAPSGKPARGRWLERLGLKDADQQ
jgi:chromosome segregation ATPase